MSEEYEFELKDEIATLRKQLIELQTDKVELISQRDNWIGSSDALRKQLDIAVEAIKQFLERMEDEKDTSMDTTLYVIDGLRDALAEIEKIGG
jgi:hypothetical protein